MQAERRSSPDALLVQLGLAAPTVRGGWRGEAGAGRVLVLGSGHPADDATLTTALRDAGVLVDVIDEPAHGAGSVADRPLVVATDDDDEPGRRLAEVNRLCLDDRVPWLPISAFDGAVVHVGPLVVPGTSACFECVRRRLAAVPAYASLYDSVISGAPAAPMPRAVRSWVATVAALVVSRYLTTGRHDVSLPGRLLTLDPHEVAVHRSTVLRVPRCPACGGGGRLRTSAAYS